MGFYINPKTQSKEDWLAANGVAHTEPPKKHRVGDDVAVCLVDNGWMTAAGIAYSQDELEVFSMEDGRSKVWYTVPIALLEPYIELRYIADPE